MNAPFRRLSRSVGLMLGLVALALLPSGSVSAQSSPAEMEKLAGRARNTLRQILAGKVSWEQLHAAEALIACGDGAVVHDRFLTEAVQADPPFRTSIWRMLALTSANAAERRGWIDQIEKVLLLPDASDRFTAAEILSKFQRRLGGKYLEQARKLTADPVESRALYGWWVLAVANEPGAEKKITSDLGSDDPAARGGAASILRWLRPSERNVLTALAQAADREPPGSPALTSVVGAALLLEADPDHAPRWRSRLEEVVKKGPGRPRWAALQALMPFYRLSDLPGLEPYLDAPDSDSRTGAAWTILHVLGGAGAALGAKQPDLRYADVVLAAAKFDDVIVWQGLPRATAKASRDEKRAAKMSFTLGDQRFYLWPPDLSVPEKAALSDGVLKHPDNFQPWSGVKFCGGFHADFAIEWQYQNRVLARVLLCFGCHEAQFRVGDRTEQVDLTAQGFEYFTRRLEKYSRERPSLTLGRSEYPEMAPAGSGSPPGASGPNPRP